MRNDILKELLAENRYMVEIERWQCGGDIVRFFNEPLPFDSPIIGSSKTNGNKYPNSGGRSILVENNSHAYKLKGIDPFGNIVKSWKA